MFLKVATVGGVETDHPAGNARVAHGDQRLVPDPERDLAFDNLPPNRRFGNGRTSRSRLSESWTRRGDMVCGKLYPPDFEIIARSALLYRQFETRLDRRQGVGRPKIGRDAEIVGKDVIAGCF